MTGWGYIRRKGNPRSSYVKKKNRRAGCLQHDGYITVGQKLKENKKRKEEERGKAHSSDPNDQVCVGYCSNMGLIVTYTGFGILTLIQLYWM
jgi:hypothetical protein